MGDLLNAMKDPKASKEDNLARQQLYNSANWLLRQAGVPGTGQFDVPGWQGQNPPVGNPVNPFQQMLRGQFPGMFNAPGGTLQPPNYNFQAPPRP